MNTTPSSSTETLIGALRGLARDIESGDGIANAAIAEAADRMEELHTLVNDGYDFIDLYSGGAPYCMMRRKDWLDKARKCGAEPSL